MKLIIVESPTKAKTIAKFLGSAYRLESSFGHIRDLPAKELGIDIENNFTPKYIIPDKSKKKVAELKKLAQSADLVVLASDDDREGEAIAWHLVQALSLKEGQYQRIVFHEITSEAISGALKEPRGINLNLVDAQQARRVLDRLVGYKLSPFLWKKVLRGLSAGRVQSVAVRLVVEKEREIQAFIPQEYWDLNAYFKKDKLDFSAKLLKIDQKSLDKFYFKNESDISKIVQNLKGASFSVAKIEAKEGSKNPLPPFITSTLQQAANNRLGFSAKQTMMIAQKLYEKGFITYMRTDSFNLSDKFRQEAKQYLRDNLGDKYLSSGKGVFKNKNKKAQEAHEAIRPTSALLTAENLGSKLDRNQSRLYQLIWQRAIASQMSPAILDTVAIDISAGQYLFRANGQRVKFKGYLEVYPEKVSENDLPNLELKELLTLKKLEPDQHFTQAPARYSDASLVKELEKHGIGRPSTYAPTIATIIDRNYVQRDDKKRLFPTDIAYIVNDVLVEHFPNIVNYKFTAEMENDLDRISLGEKKWQPVVNDFWQDFSKNLEKKEKELDKESLVPAEESDEICELCGAKMLVKIGRYGKFLSCSDYPKCKSIKSLKSKDVESEDNPELLNLKEKLQGETCDLCGAEMIVRSGRFGYFLGCSQYPKCKGIKNIDPKGEKEIEVDCPLCGQGKIVKKFSRRGPFYACSAYPDCRNAYNSRPTGEKCSKCGSLMIESKDGSRCSNKECLK